MRKIIFSLLLAVLLLNSPILIQAQTTIISPTPDQSNQQSSQTASLTGDPQILNNLPTPILLPDSPFYFLKRWGENIQTFFTIDDYQKAQLQLQFAQNRLAEANAELRKNRTDLTDKMLSDYNHDMDNVNKATQKLEEEGKEVTGLVDKIHDHEDKRLAILYNRLSKATNDADRQTIARQIKFVKRQSQTNINRLVNALTTKPGAKNNSPYRSFTGQITAVNNPSFTVQVGKNSMTFTTDSNTKFRKFESKDTASFTDLAVGNYVQVAVQKNALSGPARSVVVNVPLTLVQPLVGTIANFSSNSFTLNTANGAYTINVNMDTRWSNNGKDDAQASAIKAGTEVRVFAVPQGNNTYLARRIVAELPKKVVRNGVITNIQGNQLTLQAKNSQTYTIILDGNTIVQLGKKSGSSTDLAVGETIHVTYSGLISDTTGTATLIIIRRPKNNAKNSQVQSVSPTVTPSATITPSIVPSITSAPTATGSL